ncbi:hypothetical protein, partial [Streptococcus equinus]|uniref:hypothetical protein n=1 Tax=Streptococcus equinus TaxID=1335 RepID=UPI0019596966
KSNMTFLSCCFFFEPFTIILEIRERGEEANVKRNYSILNRLVARIDYYQNNSLTALVLV